MLGDSVVATAGISTSSSVSACTSRISACGHVGHLDGELSHVGPCLHFVDELN